MEPEDQNSAVQHSTELAEAYEHSDIQIQCDIVDKVEHIDVKEEYFPDTTVDKGNFHFSQPTENVCESTKMNTFKQVTEPIQQLRDKTFNCDVDMNMEQKHFLENTTDSRVSDQNKVSDQGGSLSEIQPDEVQIKCEPLTAEDDQEELFDLSENPPENKTDIRVSDQNKVSDQGGSLSEIQPDEVQIKCEPLTAEDDQEEFIDLSEDVQGSHVHKDTEPHTEKKQCRCPVCDMVFSQEDILKKHLKSHGEKPYTCTACQRTFNYPGILKIHMRIHSGEKPFKCLECGKAFSQGGTLKKHAGIHNSERPHACSKCEKTFSHVAYLKAHLRTHTAERPYKCEECEKAFNEMGHLKSHMRTHSGEKPYTCRECGKAFSQASTLRNHLRTHSGLRPFTCVECGKAFGQASILKDHMRIHTGDRPYKCTLCERAFNRSHHLKVHVTRIHNK